MKNPTKLLFVFSCFLFLQNCTDDDFDSRTIPNQQTEADILKDEEFRADNFGALTTGDFIGLIRDIDGNNILGAQITIGNSVTTTDRNGMFILNNADVYKNFAYIKVQKEGYINGSRVVIPKTTGENRIDIVLLKKEVTATVSSGQFSEVSLPNGAKVNFSGGFVRQNGTEYTGQVEVVLHYIEPNSILNTFRQMPGSLLAQTEANDARNLETYGMLSVNLFSPSGEQLNINEFNRATIEFPVHYSQTSTAPDFIPLWYFDEAQGYWKEEGQAVKFGDRYVGEVSHFTWWNCDIPFDSVALCFNLTPDNISLTTPYYLTIQRSSNNVYIYSGIAFSGQLQCGLVPRNEEVFVSIYGLSESCNNQLVHTQTLGGYATDTNVDISYTEQASVTSINGTVTNCAGNPITNGYLHVDDFNSFAITDGIINIGLQHCFPESITIQVFDFDTNQWAIVENITLNGNTINLGALSTCEDTGGIFNGNLKLSTQQEVNDFGAFGFTSVNGNVTIGDENNFTDIVDLSLLSSITQITDNLTIVGNENLTSLQGLESISQIGNEINIKNNPSLPTLAGFNSLTNVSSLVIDKNDGLTSLVGFSNTFTIGQSLRIINNENLTSLQGIENFGFNSQKDLYIFNNDALVSLQGVENIAQLRFLTIRNNDALNTLTAFESLTKVLDLIIDNNDALVTLVGLEQLVELRILIIANNEVLQNLNGLENLVTLTPSIFIAVNIGAIQWENYCTGYNDGPNPNLTDFCAIQTLINTHQWDINGSSHCAVIVNNAYNPTLQDFMDGNCSQ